MLLYVLAVAYVNLQEHYTLNQFVVSYFENTARQDSIMNLFHGLQI